MYNSDDIPLEAWLVLTKSGPDLFQSELHYLAFKKFRNRLICDAELVERIDQMLGADRSLWSCYVSSLINASVIFNQEAINKYIKNKKRFSQIDSNIKKRIEKDSDLFENDNDIKNQISDILNYSTVNTGPYHNLIKQSANIKTPKTPFLSAIWLLWKREIISNGGKYPNKILLITYVDFALLAEMALDLPTNSITTDDIKIAKRSAENHASQDGFFS